MEKGLKKREKVLIFALAMVVLVYVAAHFVIFPLFTQLSNVVYERERLTGEVSALAADIANIPVLHLENQQARERHLQATQLFPLLIPNEEIDPILTNLVLQNGLKPTALRFTDAVGAAQAVGGVQKSSPYVFTVVSVSMNLSGSYSSLVRLLDDVDTREYIRITNLSFTSGRDESLPESSRVTLAFELTFLND